MGRSRARGLLLCGVAALAILLLASTATPPSSAASTWVSGGRQLDPDGIVSIECMLILAPAARMPDVADGTLRCLSISVAAKSGEVMLQHEHHLSPVDVAQDTPKVLKLIDLNLAQAKSFAGKLLGVDVPHAEPAYSDTYEITIRPVEGKTWGDVANRSDFDLSVVVKPKAG